MLFAFLFFAVFYKLKIRLQIKFTGNAKIAFQI